VAWHQRALWYLPNRLMDAADMFRVRLRLGPGFAAHARVTDYGAFYLGTYRSVYLGLPGPRYPNYFRPPWGPEELKGLVLFGVDATDLTPDGPEYSPTEIALGAHLGLAGAEAGFDPFELGDFLTGWFCIDFGEDDYPRPHAPPPDLTSAISVGPGRGMFRVDPRPGEFASWGARLDYLNVNVHKRVSEPFRLADEQFVDPKSAVPPAPTTRFRLGVFGEVLEGADSDFEIEPDFDLDVELPNLERKLRVFIGTERDDDLPGRAPTEREDSALAIGARRWNERLNLSTDLGVKTRIPPEAFARVSWKPQYEIGDWGFRPEQRLFFTTEDKWGELTSMRWSRWLGEQDDALFVSTTSGKWTDESDEYRWEQSLRLVHILSLLDETRRGRIAGTEDIALGYGVTGGVFGERDTVNTYRASLTFRAPLYQRWIFWELNPGLQWDRDSDFDTAYRITGGVAMYFWGVGFE